MDKVLSYSLTLQKKVGLGGSRPQSWLAGPQVWLAWTSHEGEGLGRSDTYLKKIILTTSIISGFNCAAVMRC